MVSNRQIFAKGREVGPTHTIRQNMMLRVLAGGTVGTIPVIMGNPAAYSNMWRRISGYYEYYPYTKQVIINADSQCVTTFMEYINNSDNPLVVFPSADLTWTTAGLGFEEFMGYLSNNKLLLKQLEVLIVGTGTLARNGTFIGPAPYTAQMPFVQLGIYNSTTQKNTLDRVSTQAYIDPNYGKYKDIVSPGVRPDFSPRLVRIPCDIVLSDKTAIVLEFDVKDSLFGNLGVQIGLTVAPFE